jgi:hypothetical protein
MMSGLPDHSLTDQPRRHPDYEQKRSGLSESLQLELALVEERILVDELRDTSRQGPY